MYCWKGKSKDVRDNRTGQCIKTCYVVRPLCEVGRYTKIHVRYIVALSEILQCMATLWSCRCLILQLLLYSYSLEQ
jgi:hypothetical protein